MDNQILKGIGISPGLAMAKVLQMKKAEMVVPDEPIAPEAVETELTRFADAHRRAIAANDKLFNAAREKLSEADAAVFSAHKDFLEDRYSVVEPIEKSIREKYFNAAKAVDACLSRIISVFESMDDELMRARSADARDIRELLLAELLGIESADISKLQEKTIIAAHEITPSDTARMDLSMVVGFISEVGGPTSHSAIIARNLEIPAVSCIDGLESKLCSGTRVLIDGTKGTVQTDISESDFVAYQADKLKEKELRELCREYIGKATVTADGHRLQLWANIGSPKDLPNVLAADAEGIGLFRSEFLYMDCETLPDEETQFNAYKTVLEKMAPKPVVIRTLDIGGDKALPALELPAEANPFLGFRAIRICLDRPELFKVQLRALLRAGIYGNLHIMFPMISSISELRAAKEILNEAKAELAEQNIPFSDNAPVGIMVEVPSTAILADDFAKEADFFSIGTNDLTQYTLAADRCNTKLAYLSDAGHPAVLSLIKNTVEAAHRNGISCGLCGEAGGDPRLQPVLVRYGLDELSMTPSALLKSRMMISKMNYSEQ